MPGEWLNVIGTQPFYCSDLPDADLRTISLAKLVCYISLQHGSGCFQNTCHETRVIRMSLTGFAETLAGPCSLCDQW